jgi:hypothetical protein
MRCTLLFACFILAACSQERQSRVDTLRSAPVETTADYSSRTVAPEADVRDLGPFRRLANHARHRGFNQLACSKPRSGHNDHLPSGKNYVGRNVQ